MYIFFIIISSIMALIGLLVVVELGALAELFWVVKNLLTDLRDRIDPVVDKTSSLLTTVNTVACNVQGDAVNIADKASDIANKASSVTDTVSARVDKTTWLLEKAVTSPIISVMAAAVGVRQGIVAWRNRQRRPHREVGRVTRMRLLRPEEAMVVSPEETVVVMPEETVEVRERFRRAA